MEVTLAEDAKQGEPLLMKAKRGRLGNSLSLFTSVIGFYFCIVCSSKSKESVNVTYESWHHRY